MSRRTWANPKPRAKKQSDLYLCDRVECPQYKSARPLSLVCSRCKSQRYCSNRCRLNDLIYHSPRCFVRVENVVARFCASFWTKTFYVSPSVCVCPIEVKGVSIPIADQAATPGDADDEWAGRPPGQRPAYWCTMQTEEHPNADGVECKGRSVECDDTFYWQRYQTEMGPTLSFAFVLHYIRTSVLGEVPYIADNAPITSVSLLSCSPILGEGFVGIRTTAPSPSSYPSFASAAAAGTVHDDGTGTAFWPHAAAPCWIKTRPRHCVVKLNLRDRGDVSRALVLDLSPGQYFPSLGTDCASMPHLLMGEAEHAERYTTLSEVRVETLEQLYREMIRSRGNAEMAVQDRRLCDQISRHMDDCRTSLPHDV